MVATTSKPLGSRSHRLGIAVKQGDAEWAKEAMERVWSEETLGGKTKLKVDYPD